MKLGMTERHVDQSLFKACSRAGEILPPGNSKFPWEICPGEFPPPVITVSPPDLGVLTWIRLAERNFTTIAARV